MIDLNVRALADLTLRFLPGMIAKASGGIINIASVASFMPGPQMAVYFATKTFVLSFTDAVYEEVRNSGVTVMSLCPGPVETNFQARAGMKRAGALSRVRRSASSPFLVNVMQSIGQMSTQASHSMQSLDSNTV